MLGGIWFQGHVIGETPEFMSFGIFFSSHRITDGDRGHLTGLLHF